MPNLRGSLDTKPSLVLVLASWSLEVLLLPLLVSIGAIVVLFSADAAVSVVVVLSAVVAVLVSALLNGVSLP